MGMNVVVDSDNVGTLRAVVVEGKLVFKPETDPTHVRTFDAEYIFVHMGGKLEIGTEDHPYTSKLIITMHGDRKTLKIPTYGNKVIGIRHASLDIHGAPISKVKSLIRETANVGATSIRLYDKITDWKVGD